jgi:predicted O-methyltransferase YrrM
MVLKNILNIDKEKERVRTSYEENNYGMILKTFVLTMKPIVAVEVGVLDGYSAMYLGAGVQALRNVFNLYSTLDCYDLWDAYEYKHGDFNKVKEYLEGFGLDGFVKLYQSDAFEACEKYGDERVDLLHFDISNDGDKLEKLMETWHYKIRPGGIILFEGGSPERDEIEWMKRYNKKKIYPVLNENKIINEEYQWVVYPMFPSLTALFKKGE